MSWDMWHIYGIGFNVAKTTTDNLEKFILDHEESYRKADSRVADQIISYVKNKGGARELDEECHIHLYDAISEMTECYGVAEVVANIMASETGIRFDYPGITDEGEDYVLFCAAKPWDYNDIERNLTFEALTAIMELYASELGLKVHTDVDLVYAG